MSRAERRKILKEAKGDEELANQLLAERTTGMTSQEEPAADSSSDDEVSGTGDGDIVDAEIEEEAESVDDAGEVDDEGESEDSSTEEVTEVEPDVEEPPKKAPKKAFKKPAEPEDDDEELDLDNL